MTSALSVCNLRVTVGNKVVLNDFSLEIESGEIVAVMGPNGSGKSTLANVLMGNPLYSVDTLNKPVVTLEGADLLAMSVDERIKAGLFVSWQTPVSIPGVTVFSLCKASYEAVKKESGQILQYGSLTEFKQKLEAIAVRVGLTPDHIARNVNEGFSGGERKRLELLQIILLNPKIVVLDEIDSGLDVLGVETLIKIVKEMQKLGTSFVLISHSKKLIEDLEVRKIWKTIN